MNNIAMKILALWGASKDIHYLALLKRDWATHKLMDEIAVYDGDELVNDWLDNFHEVMEICVNGDFMYSAELLAGAAEIIKRDLPKPKDIAAARSKLAMFINGLLDDINSFARDCPLGSNNLVAGWAQSLQQRLSWLGNEIEGDANADG